MHKGFGLAASASSKTSFSFPYIYISLSLSAHTPHQFPAPVVNVVDFSRSYRRAQCVRCR